MNYVGENSKALQKRAQKVVPLGVNSNFRFWGDGATLYLDKAKGPYVWDVDGKCYIDYRLAFGPIILGHAFDEVDAQVIEAIKLGALAAITYEMEVALIERIVEMCPAIDMARLACSGTEATMHAVRIARAYTGRELLLKFEGNYHGFHDHLLWSTYAPPETYGSLRSPIPVAASSGIPRSMSANIITLPFNDFEGFERVMQAFGDQIAAVIAEPCQGNCGAIDPLPGFLDLVRKLTSQYGAVFILDEVKTGFRLANGGAQEYYNVRPDMATYAKAMGNGYPIAAFGGKKEIMRIIGHGVAQGGTYTNNKPGVAAAFATLSILKQQPIIATIMKRGQRLMEGLKEIFEENSIPVVFGGPPSMFSFAVGIEKPTNQREWTKSERDYYLRLVDAAIARGVMPDHDAREPWFLSYSHSDADIDETLNVFADIVKTVKR